MHMLEREQGCSGVFFFFEVLFTWHAEISNYIGRERNWVRWTRERGKELMDSMIGLVGNEMIVIGWERKMRWGGNEKEGREEKEK